MSRADERSRRERAIAEYNEHMADRYALRRIGPDELPDIAWPVPGSDERARVVKFPDGLATVVARHAARTTPQFELASVVGGVIDIDGWPERDRKGLGYALVAWAAGNELSGSIRELRAYARRLQRRHIAGLTTAPLDTRMTLSDEELARRQAADNRRDLTMPDRGAPAQAFLRRPARATATEAAR